MESMAFWTAVMLSLATGLLSTANFSGIAKSSSLVLSPEPYFLAKCSDTDRHRITMFSARDGIALSGRRSIMM